MGIGLYHTGVGIQTYHWQSDKRNVTIMSYKRLWQQVRNRENASGRRDMAELRKVGLK